MQKRSKKIILITVICSFMISFIPLAVFAEPGNNITKISVGYFQDDIPWKIYFVGEPFREIGSIYVYYENGTRDTIPLTKEMITNFDTSNAQMYRKCNISYKGFHTDYNIQVFDSSVTLSLIGYCFVRKYEVGDAYKDSDWSIGIDDSSGRRVDSTSLHPFMIPTFDTSKVGEFSIPINFLGTNHLRYRYSVVPKTIHVESIEILPRDHIVMKVGETKQFMINYTPIDAVTGKDISWSVNTSFASVDQTGLVTAKNPTTFTLKAKSSEGFEDSIQITIVSADVKEITFEGLKDIYELNEALAIQGNVIVTYEDSATTIVPLTADMVSNFDTSSIGEKVAHIAYNGFVADFHYTVIDPSQGGEGEDAMTVISSEKGIQTLIGEAIEKYFNPEGKLPKTGGLDSTGPNFGQDMKATVKELLGIETGNFDFRIYRNGSSDSYKIYIFDLTGKYEGDTVEVTGFQYENGNVSEPTAVQDVTIISKITADVFGNPVTHLTINGEEFRW